MTKYYRTVITVEVLSDEPYNPASLAQVAHDTISGGCSGNWKITSSEEVTVKRMAELLEAQGSDPSFLIMEEDDKD